MTSYSEYHDRILTPRTPHSRAGRAEEGFTAVELDTFGEDESTDYRQQQSQPLLSPGYRSRGDDQDVRIAHADRQFLKYWLQTVLGRLPLVIGSVLAITFMILIGISFKQPGSLEAALLGPPVKDLDADSSSSNVVTTSSIPPERLISYENYTRFPLTGDQYREECGKIMKGFMPNIGYWTTPPRGPLDVPHHDDNLPEEHLPEGGLTRVCSSTITYMLDGHVGLAADLALMAQAAAMAREVSATSACAA